MDGWKVTFRLDIVELLRSASLTGDISTMRISIEDGASLKARLTSTIPSLL